MEFSERLSNLVTEAGVNYLQLAKSAGIPSDRAVGGWCKGEKKPSFENILLLADYFGVTTDYLMGRSDERGAGVEGLSGQEVSLLGLFRELPDDAHRDMVFGQVKAAVVALSGDAASTDAEGERKKETPAQPSA